MRVGIHVGHWEREPADLTAVAQEAERAGLDSVWTSEAWGSDGLVLLTWIAAHTRHIAVGTGILQIPARTPANVAMAAITLDHLSGGRLRLGLGTSGPQVAEGWYGEPYERPLERSDEYIRIIRAILQRKDPVRFEGAHYRLPAAGGTGLGNLSRPRWSRCVRTCPSISPPWDPATIRSLHALQTDGCRYFTPPRIETSSRTL